MESPLFDHDLDLDDDPGILLLMLLAASSQLLSIAPAWPYPCAACLPGSPRTI
ncbi:hypothetical protein [Aquisphaera insulae]|uniref:hypothetical protein n=1 Tax=Aquisphaera insulae TaxID=2712864 RepID=UPI0013EE129D|nr:hypothetical protein [Aquisphaera insulae]